MYSQKSKRILLISPPYTIFKGRLKTSMVPLGLAYIAAVLEENKHVVKVLDAAVEGFEKEINIGKDYIRYGLSFEEIEKIIKEFDPHIVGVSCSFSPQIKNCYKIIDIAKKIDKKIITVMGGEHCSALPEKTLNDNKNLDIVIIGEGEYSFLDVVKGNKLEKIDGIAFWKNNKIKVNPKKKFIYDLDELPLPARHLLPMKKYFKIGLPLGSTYSKRKPLASIITSRGCPAKCVFCATRKFWGNCFRGRDPIKVVDEIEMLVKKYKVREIQFIDDNLTLDKKRAMEIFKEIIKRKIDISWCTPNGVALWALDEELLDLMKKSGCYELTLAIESGNQRVLSTIIKKPLNLEKAERLIKYAKKIGILTHAFYVVGFPDETMKEIKDTIDFAKKMDTFRASFFIANPLPGTDLFEICKEKGYLLNFDMDNIDYSMGFIQTENFSVKELEKLVNKETLKYTMKSFLRNPFEFFRRYVLFGFRHPNQFLRYVKTMIVRS